MKNVFIVCAIFFFSCKEKSSKEIKDTVLSQGYYQKKANKVNNEYSPSLDSLELDSLLYSGKFKLPEISSGRFSFEKKIDQKNRALKIISRKYLVKTDIEYQIKYKIIKSGIDFNFYNDSDYIYKTSTLNLFSTTIDLTNVKFINDSNELVYPAGPWHWSIAKSAAKYFRYNQIEYFLINGVNLFCNGNHCTSFQVYLIAKHNNKFYVSAFYVTGVYPYYFDAIKLIDSNKNGFPEIYIPKTKAEKFKSIRDFDLYEIKDNSVEVINY